MVATKRKFSFPYKKVAKTKDSIAKVAREYITFWNLHQLMARQRDRVQLMMDNAQEYENFCRKVDEIQTQLVNKYEEMKLEIGDNKSQILVEDLDHGHHVWKKNINKETF